jgi:hypothetical protein
MGNETGETQTLPPFPLGHGARRLKRAKHSGPPVTAWDAAQSIFELRRTPGLARSLRLRKYPQHQLTSLARLAEAGKPMAGAVQ